MILPVGVLDGDLAISERENIGGFSVMRRAPSLGAFVVVVASAAFAATIFWLIVPPLLAIAVSVYAIRRARRLQQRG